MCVCVCCVVLCCVALRVLRGFQHLTPDKPPKAVELHTYSLQRHPGAGPAAPAAQLPANAVMAEYAARPFRLSGGPSEGQGGGGTGGAQGEGTAASPLLLNAAAASFQQVGTGLQHTGQQPHCGVSMLARATVYVAKI